MNAAEKLLWQNFILDRNRRQGLALHTFFHGGASVPVNGAVFKTVCEFVRANLGWFDSDTPPPKIKDEM